MCGIVGYIGKRRASPVLLDGLKKLEYRGYDSAGIAVLDRGTLRVVKRQGRVEELGAARSLDGCIGIGHTRWATHGAPSARNAHPHVFCGIAVVHNGIIENAAALRALCLARGETFLSDTDSEVVAHLIAHAFCGDLLSAVMRAARELTGSFALAVLREGGEEIVCARKKSPLIAAAGEGESFVASDIPAIAASGRRAYILQDGEFARLTAEDVKLYDENGALIAREGVVLEEGELAPERGTYAHFMRKEIDEIPRAVQNSLFSADYFQKNGFSEVLCQTEYIDIVACGTAYHSGLCAKAAIEELLRIPVRVFLASEYRYTRPIVRGDALTIAVSQSGETADTLAAAQLAKEKGCKVLALTNCARSSLTRMSDLLLVTGAGREVGVAATKSFQAQLAALYSLCAALANFRKKRVPSPEDLLPLCGQSIRESAAVAGWAPCFAAARNVFFLGRGADRCAALEGSLKFKEITYLPAEGYAAGELKHGALALADETTPVVALAFDERLAEKTMNAVHEVYARGAPVFLVTCFPALCGQKEVSSFVLLPACEPAFSPMLSVIPLQLLAYETAVFLKNDPDKPRNLAKSVTVE